MTSMSVETKIIHDTECPKGDFFIELPNWNRLGRLVKGSFCSQLKPPEHINFFTSHSGSCSETSGI
jgi:hypothetical protein